MSVENGEWIMHGLAWDDPYRIRSPKELVNWIKEVGFLPLLGNGVKGFSVEEHVSADYWWSGDKEQDPWEWREIIAAGHEDIALILSGQFPDWEKQEKSAFRNTDCKDGGNVQLLLIMRISCFDFVTLCSTL